MIILKRSTVVVLGLLFSFFSYARAEEAAEELDPNGPWMICNISVDGLKNIRKRTVTKAAHAKKGELYERMTITEDVQGGIWDGEWRMNDVSGNDKIEAQSQDNSVPLYIIMCNLMMYNR